MSKLAALLASRCRLHAGGLCVAACALTPLAMPAVAAGLPEPRLKLTEELDIRRLDKLSDDERSVLRLEWRAGMTGVEEGHTVAEMLLSLQRMEQTVADVMRLIRDMPTPQRQAPPPPPPPPADDTGLPLAMAGAGLGGLAVGGLVAWWWFRRRQMNATLPLATPPRAAPKPPPRPNAPDKPSPPQPSPPRPSPPQVAQTPRPPPAPAAAAPVPSEPWALAAAATTQKLASGTGPSAGDPPAMARPPRTEPAPAPTPHVTAVDFLLEDASTEEEARANRRTPPAPSPVRTEAALKADEDHEPTLELANIMLSMGLADGAAQTLIEYVEANPRQALYHWLKLLDIYTSTSNSKDFKETAEKLRLHFNIQADNWANAQTGEEPTLESFPHVCEILQRTWSARKDCIEYLEHLLKDNRAGLRTGFPRPVAEEFLLLIEILKDLGKPVQAAAA